MIEPGSRWREVETGRIATILASEVHGTGPSYVYDDDDDDEWHYCDVADFVLWGRWEPVDAPSSASKAGDE